jgi:hypothetical protein
MIELNKSAVLDEDVIPMRSPLELSRRQFVAAAALATSTSLPGTSHASPASASWSFALLGDTHFDRLAHHDLEWLAKEHPGDVNQVQRYCEHTRSLLPELLETVRTKIAAAKSSFDSVVHVGDLVEGLCGTPELAGRHVDEGLEFIGKARWEVPLLLTKGNHDVTGPGAAEMYERKVLPYLSRQIDAPVRKPRYAVERRGALFVMFDTYDRTAPDWLRETLGKERRRSGPTFVVMHQPMVPFQARGNWSVLIRPEQAKARAEMLNLLGEHRAIVLGGHVHRYGVVIRSTERGPFAQLAVSSILSSRDQQPKQLREGLDAYGPELTELEPKFQPASKEERQQIFAAEKPFIKHYEYAEAAGHAILHVAGQRVTADICLGTSAKVWRTIDLSDLLTR